MVLTDCLGTFSENVLAVEDSGQSVSYKEIGELVKRLSNVFLEKPLVFDLASNTIGSLVGYLAFMEVEAVPLMLSDNVDKDLFLSLMETYVPNYLWIPKQKLELYGVGKRIVLEYRDYCLIDNSSINHNLNKDLALLLSTSGSTGSSKLVRLSYSNVLANASSITSYLQIDKSDRPITSLPMYYSYGLSVINSHVLNGATILLTNYSVLQMEFWQFFKAQNATSFAGVPYTYEMLARIKFERMNLPTLRTMTQAGGKLSKELVEVFARIAIDKGYRFFVMYGQTEATARMSYLPFERVLEKSTSIGVAIPGGQFKLCDECDNLIEDVYVDGELCYVGPNVYMGYATSMSDLTLGDTIGNLLKTGDIAHVDKDGYYYITGRKSRFVKIFGNRIGLDSVEQILKKRLSECACTGNDNKIDVYLIELPDFDVVSFLSEKLHLHPSAFSLHIIEEIPKSESGKILYAKL